MGLHISVRLSADAYRTTDPYPSRTQECRVPAVPCWAFHAVPCHGLLFMEHVQTAVVILNFRDLRFARMRRI